ncbi:MAG: tetratricopeptide repeat protein [Chitinivibrionales bacterium]
MLKSTSKNPKEKKQPLPPIKSLNPASVQSLNKDFILGFLLFILLFAAYQPALNGMLLWDDDHHITRPELRSIDGLKRIWSQLGATQQYYPLVHSVFWLEYHLWDDSTLGYHLVNILLHFFSTLLLVCILRRLAIPGAWFVAAIFALHPIQVESVAWITELKNMLSGIFFFASTLLYLKFDSERKRKYYLIAISLFILGLMSKSAIAMLPVSLLVIFWWKRGKINWKNDVVPLLPFFLVGIISGLFTAWVERKFVGAEGSAFTFTIIERCLIAGRATWFYLGKIFFPFNLIFIYTRWNVSQAIWWQYLFPIATLAFAGVLWVLRKRSRAPLAAFLFFIVMIFPALGFFNVYPFRFSFVADHFQYIACIGPITLGATGVSWALNLLKGKLRNILWLIIYVIILTLCVVTFKQSSMYTDVETLYKTTLKKNPACWMAHYNLAEFYSKAGRTDEAIVQYWKTIETEPDHVEAYCNLGILLTQAGQFEEAIDCYKKALKIKPDYSRVSNNIGILLAKTGRIEEAIVFYRKALEIDPKNVKIQFNLGNIYFQAGQTAEAISQYQKALEIAPDDISILDRLLVVLEQSGHPSDAISFLQKLLESAKSNGQDILASNLAAELDKLNQPTHSGQQIPR